MREIEFRGKLLKDVFYCNPRETKIPPNFFEYISEYSEELLKYDPRVVMLVTRRKGEWVYGNLVTDGSKCWIAGKIIDASDESISFGSWFPVDPATVGQYIGQKDINKVKVFTGNMVKADLYGPDYQYMAHPGFHVFSMPYICEVVFEGFCYMLKVIDYADKSRFKPGKVPKIPKSMDYIGMADNLTVIGNRWDNPELLGVKP